MGVLHLSLYLFLILVIGLHVHLSFISIRECEEAFVKLKAYLASSPVLCKPQMGTPLGLYFAITEKAISAVLVQDQDQVQKPIYFVSKVLQGPEVRYQALENPTSSMSPEDRSRGKSSLTLWSSYLLKQCRVRGMIFVGCSRWMGRLTSWVAELESFWKDPTVC